MKDMKKKLKKLISFIPLFIIIILILWYKSPINGIKCYPESVSKIDITYNGNAIIITNTNDINCCEFPRSFSFNRSL